MKTSAILLLTALFSLSSVVPAIADPGNGKGNGNGQHKNSQAHQNKGNKDKSKGHHANDSLDTSVHINLSFDRAREIAVHHGLTGYQSLPPGIAKNLARGKPLPPGIAKKQLPASFIRELPVYSGHEWVMAGRDLILIAVATGLVVDIINNVFD